MEFGVKGKVALVTGAGGGIGGSIAQYLNQENAFVYLIDRDEKGLNDVLNNLPNQELAKVIPLDITDYNAVKTVIDDIALNHATPEIVVNAAGIAGLNTPIFQLEEEDFNRIVKVNLNGTYNIIRHASLHMVELGRGKIINIASMAGVAGSNLFQSHYAASKGGVISLTRSVAKELGPKGINVNAIAPGVIETQMIAGMKSEAKQDYFSKIPLQRIGNPEDVGKVALFLASDLSIYMTGQILNVDGGIVMA
ncbi:SDR family oxidoreductase [Alkalihalobacterium alkalinitrilicum]|uniref:SDR family oxidoreductase n=1 Tax=Alkalihalobacterium alkalinitrilicum TaxID=427920 RepID=UPI000994ED1C|nr:SDR family NAD(P)-dependent oxidoreductase [Alkalihalobacterium alkalinitrilicum]